MLHNVKCYNVSINLGNKQPILYFSLLHEIWQSKPGSKIHIVLSLFVCLTKS